MTDLAAASHAYQTQLEMSRRPWDDLEDREHALEDLVKARRAVEVAWLKHTAS